MSELSNNVTINKKYFFVEQDEFMEIKHEGFSNLKILKDVGEYERITGLLCELTKVTAATTRTNANTNKPPVKRVFPLATENEVPAVTPVSKTVAAAGVLAPTVMV